MLAISTVLLFGTTQLPSPTPSRGMVRTVGVDFGLRRVGVAVSSGIASLPLRVLACQGTSEEDFKAVATSVANIVRGEGATQVVVGMPFNSTGGEGEQAAITRKFAAILADIVGTRPVFLWDERFSSAEAKMRMNGGRGAARGEFIDAVAAAVILDDFFAADEALSEGAIHVPSSAVNTASPAGEGPRAVVKLPIPPSATEVRRQMMERSARESAALDIGGKIMKSKGRKAVRPPAVSDGDRDGHGVAAGDGGTCTGSNGRIPGEGHQQGQRTSGPGTNRRRGSRIDRFSID